MKKFYFGGIVAWIMATMLCLGITSCSKSDDEELNLSETQIKQYLESGEGIWQVVEYDENGNEDNKFQTQFKDGKTYGYFGPWESYTISGNRLYSKSFDNGSIYFYKLDANSFEGKWNNSFRMVGKKVK